MGKVTKKEMPMWAKTGHRKPTTRREFLAHGLIPFAARALVPGALGLLTGPMMARAQGLNCASETVNNIPFITVNLAGGAGLSANYMPTDAGGSPLASYSKMGQGSGANIPQRVSEFGVQSFFANSQFLAGVQRVSTAEARGRTAFVAVCVQSRDDSGENAFDASGMAYRAGVIGSILPNLGSRGTPTGLNMKPSTVSPPSPLVVNSFTTVANSIGYTAALRNNLTVQQREKVANLTSNLSASQARKLASINTAAHVQTLIECAGIKNAGLVTAGADSINPLADASVGGAIGQLYGINNGTAVNNENRVFATMAYNALKGNAGTVNLERGGYDYHNGTRTLGDQRDGQAGEAVGRILQMAHLMQKPVFIYVTSDGSVVSTDSAQPGSNWISDRGSAGALYFLMYHPSGRPLTTGFQIGHFEAGQQAAANTPVGNNPALAAQAVFANYTKFAYGNAWESYFLRAVPRGGLEGSALASVIKVA